MALNFTRRQWMTLLIMGLADFCNAICVSLQAPFFPQEAERKGCIATEYGLVFGVFELVVMIVSPLYGQYLNKIGPKVLFNAGILTTSTSVILFGLLDRIPGHTAFITLAFVIRIIEALGNAAFLTASFTIIAKEFPNNVATTFASLETCFGLGLIVGPMLGGALYSVGGYFLPFVVLGLSLFITALLTLCILPHHKFSEEEQERTASLFYVLKIPGVLICALAIAATSASIGFISATLEPHLRQFELGPVLLGVIFVINGGVYALTAPVYGWVLDKCFNPKLATIMGTMLICVGFCFVGPVPFIQAKTTLGLVITGLVLHGFGIAAVLVSSFTDALKTAVKHGLPDNIETYGLISGLWTSTFAFGAFVGPSVSGFLFDSVGFRASTLFIIGLHLIVAVITFLFVTCCNQAPGKYKEISSTDPLLTNTDDQSIGDHIIKNENGSLISSNSAIHIDNCRPCGMANNLLTCNSYNTKQTHWARLESGSTANLSFRPNYGTLEAGCSHHIHGRGYETIS
ncbi:MFS-type transporter SLC18B1-like isoform X2 [Culicoides brevitarsis]|uniref:MFS-type transporter SLC18B1-like isoform X2 n=1 Tax=Culicoides brevitarsis TaxID=469753 RepID=UPI00307C580E